MLIDQTIKDLVEKIERESVRGEGLDALFRELIVHLRANCEKDQAKERYAGYREAEGVVEAYPLDEKGFARAFDPLIDEDSFFETWQKFGIVVGKGVISPTLQKDAVKRTHELMLAISDGMCDLSKPETWKNAPLDNAGTSILSRGFFEVYHDYILAELRQSVRLYVHHVLLWGRTDLWTSFDRLGVKLPEHKEAKGLPLHVDQNPNVHAGFKTTQGVLALADCPVERGTYVGVPGSKKYFPQYEHMAEGEGEYVELRQGDNVTAVLEKNKQAFPLHAGDIVSWDSRTAHANSENISDETRFIAYISAGPAREDVPELVDAREESLRSAVSKNVREALMHASKPPRYTNLEKLRAVRRPEELTLLGKLLYGKESYGTI